MNEAVWICRINELLATKSTNERRDVTIQELADYVGVTRQAIHSWKNYQGTKTISATHTAKLCAFFGVDEWRVWELVVENGEKA